ncbi:MAG: hypothetical protein E6I55_08975 [Chloroflexi bacterium]|nr:MAG: hypothetical protein E6I55_08975 [Chloroflexota bacterium]
MTGHDGPPRNEPVRAYAPGSPERIHLRQTLAEMEALAPHHLRQHIGGDGVDRWRRRSRHGRRGR